MNANQIVIIEDDPGVRFFLEEALKNEGYSVLSFVAYEDAVSAINDETDLVIMDISLPGMDGLAATSDLKKNVNVPILIITAYGTKKNALDAIKRGATDFFVKPILLDELKIIVKRILGTRKLKKEMELLREKELANDMVHGVVGRSRQMRDIFKDIEKIAATELTVLITGETGVGKEEVAKLLHSFSQRKGNFVVVNCASIPDTLLESELFGHEKGAFTGAHQQKQGKFEAADNGTIVLDEIGEMTPYLQAKLLRAVEKKEIEHLGSTKTNKVDVRVISTTNRILENEAKNGKFREDLYFRLSQMQIHVPPLRERKEDIDAIIEYILLEFEKESGRIINIAEDAHELMVQYDWPGNVRELISVIRRAAVMCDGDTITIDDLPLYLKGGFPLASQTYSDKTLDEAISELEKNMITEALKKSQGSQAQAAKLLGISERSMWYRVKKYEIDTNI
ncbi:MAG: Transcriptional regulatory protein ZraR [Syntrophorhabdus sp. PtaU1.Bin058]|nr:MAG: Transcriptional regulatory protein ZraR [Syntrophorhabdus sp. PtaU1.Bin058]